MDSIDPNIITLIRSPLALFALVVLVCNTVFAVCAAWLKKKQIFIYTIHMFMGIVFFIGTIVLWAPGLLYHPSEVKALNMSNDPLIPTVVSIVGVLVYMAYQIYTDKNSLCETNKKDKVKSTTESEPG